MHNPIPKGRLLIIGGHEDKGETPGENLSIHKKQQSQSHFEILGSLIDKIPREHHVIEIIASASAIPNEMEALYVASYKQAGFTKVGIIKVQNAGDARNPDSIKRVKGAHAVFFTGGDQEKLVELIAQTDLFATIKKKYYSDKNFIIGGTSAGAMSIPQTIITGGQISEALFHKDISIAKGLALIKGIIIDTHFIKRGRFARLAHAVTLHPSCLGIGLGEDTALLISGGDHAECIGSGMVILIDGSKIIATNINEARGSTPIFIENLKVDIIAEGSSYLLSQRRSIPTDVE